MSDTQETHSPSEPPARQDGAHNCPRCQSPRTELCQRLASADQYDCKNCGHVWAVSIVTETLSHEYGPTMETLHGDLIPFPNCPVCDSPALVSGVELDPSRWLMTCSNLNCNHRFEYLSADIRGGSQPTDA